MSDIPVEIDAAAVAHNVEVVRDRIRRAGGTAVELVAVTKTFPVEAVLAVMAAGCGVIGESYAQEVVAKLGQLPAGVARPRVHFIGRLQTNKVRSLLGVVDVVETVDRVSLATELARRWPGGSVFVQVNTTDEAQKAGCRPEETAALVALARQVGLHVEGLMTIGPAGPPEGARPAFRRLRALADELGLASCSMGMSDDLEVGVQEGATHVRVGRALFGPRVRPPADQPR